MYWSSSSDFDVTVLPIYIRCTQAKRDPGVAVFMKEMCMSQAPFSFTNKLRGINRGKAELWRRVAKVAEFRSFGVQDAGRICIRIPQWTPNLIRTSACTAILSNGH